MEQVRSSTGTWELCISVTFVVTFGENKMSTTKGFVFLDKNTLKYAYLAQTSSWGGSNSKRVEFVEDIDHATIFQNDWNRCGMPAQVGVDLAKINIVKLNVTVTRTVEIDEDENVVRSC